MPSSGFEPATPATKRPQTYALDRAATFDLGNHILDMTNAKEARLTLFSKEEMLNLSVRFRKEAHVLSVAIYYLVFVFIFCHRDRMAHVFLLVG
jgi:hypothetical protein